jgi:hypothetical protein
MDIGRSIIPISTFQSRSTQKCSLERSSAEPPPTNDVNGEVSIDSRLRSLNEINCLGELINLHKHFTKGTEALCNSGD